MKGLNVAAGKLTYEPVARDQGLEFTPPQAALELVARVASLRKRWFGVPARARG